MYVVSVLDCFALSSSSGAWDLTRAGAPGTENQHVAKQHNPNEVYTYRYVILTRYYYIKMYYKNRRAYILAIIYPGR